MLPARDLGVDPCFVATWDDYTDELFRTHAGRLYPGLRRVGPYIGEQGTRFAHWIYHLGTRRRPVRLEPSCRSPRVRL